MQCEDCNKPGTSGSVHHIRYFDNLVYHNTDIQNTGWKGRGMSFFGGDGTHPVHDIHVRVTIDRAGVIRAIETHSDATPYPPYCGDHDDAYAKLVGASLFDGFRKALYGAMGGVQGCTHITELLAFLPTAAIQTFAGLQREDSGDRKPYQLDRCHALDTRSETVRRWYPKWYKKEKSPA